MPDEALFPVVGASTSLYNRVVSELEQVILSGRLRPGEMLPRERDLAEQFGVSRTVMREAVRVLVTKGLLETKRGRGTMVRKPGSDHLAQPLSLALHSQSDEKTFQDLHHVRCILDTEIAALAAQHATDEEVARLGQIVLEMEAATKQPEVFAAKDAAFHTLMAEMTHNQVLALLAESVRSLLQRYILLIVQHLDSTDANMLDHRKLLDSIVARDPQRAREAMVADLNLQAQKLEALRRPAGSFC
mgnify:CR=1 FL=1